MDELTPEQLEAILGTDYETVLAEALRRKASADDRRNQRAPVGQVGDGNVFFDPAGVLSNVMDRRRAFKDMNAAQGDIDAALAKQTAGRRTYAEALAPKPAQPQMPPRAADSTLPQQAAQQPIADAPPMAPGAPPALANASQMPQDRLQRAGVPPEVMAMLAKLRGQQ